MEVGVFIANQIERLIHQEIDEIIANHFSVKDKAINQRTFEIAITSLREDIFGRFKAKYDQIKDHERYKNIFLNAVRPKQDELLSEPNFANVFLRVNEIDGSSDKSQTYFNSINQYCVQYCRNDNYEVIVYLTKIKALLLVFHDINGHHLNMNDNKQASEMILIAEAFQNCIVAIATGSKDEEIEYKRLRDLLLKIQELDMFLPDFVKTNRTAAQFWQFIKYKFSSYAERKQFIWK